VPKTEQGSTIYIHFSTIYENENFKISVTCFICNRSYYSFLIYDSFHSLFTFNSSITSFNVPVLNYHAMKTYEENIMTKICDPALFSIIVKPD
jgi:hypothetical protein